MDEQYDAIVLGTGLTECVLSGLLSVDGRKVLHMDRNNYYGGASASLNLEQLFSNFKQGAEPSAELGSSRDYNVDIVPKFIMASGVLVKLLLHTDVTKYMEFKVVDGSYVYKGKKISKVPASDMEALKSDLMGFLEKRRCKKFFEFVSAYDPENPKTHQGFPDLEAVTMQQVFTHFGLSQDTVEFVGHALALHRDDSYLEKPAKDTITRANLYADSLARYSKSPYIYPLYGLGELPQGFARLAAIYGGTFMLNKPVDEIVIEDGKFAGVRSEGEVAKAPIVIGSPDYFPDKVKKTGQVVRKICILSAPIPNTGNAESCQIIIPQRQANRGSDIYVSMVSATHNVCPAGKYVALVSTTVETDDPESELAPGVALLGPVVESFLSVCDTFEPIADGKEDNIYISRSYDATSHFETCTADILDVYKRITGKDADLTPKPKDDA